jgi:hypothetical protein
MKRSCYWKAKVVVRTFMKPEGSLPCSHNPADINNSAFSTNRQWFSGLPVPMCMAESTKRGYDELLASCRGVHLDKLIVPQPVMKVSLLWKQKVHYHVHKCLSLDSILN